ncbi:hypothetical protein PR048_009884 [Dryococelus australis]|uniref:Uncharacterized protein n=1 Tax=Dryococelus australis TaxID=614101 RepID=A0ABQ9I1Y2_9NEOP|nr:hypothetical protein PR048_009884 [Dryococelus australis]
MPCNFASLDPRYTPLRSRVPAAGGIRWGRGGVVVRLLTSHLDAPSPIPGGVASGFPHLGIMADVVTGRRSFLGNFQFPCLLTPALLHSHLISPSSALKTSMLRAAQMSPLFTQSMSFKNCKTVILKGASVHQDFGRAQYRLPGGHLDVAGVWLPLHLTVQHAENHEVVNKFSCGAAGRRKGTRAGRGRIWTKAKPQPRTMVQAAVEIDHSILTSTEGGELFCPDRDSSRPPMSPPEQTRDRDSHESARATKHRRARTQLTSLSAGPAWHPTANRVQFRAGSLLDFRMWESCRTMPLVGVFFFFFFFFLRFPVSHDLYSGAALYSHRFIPIGSQNLDVKSRPNLSSLHSKQERLRVPDLQYGVMITRLYGNSIHQQHGNFQGALPEATSYWPVAPRRKRGSSYPAVNEAKSVKMLSSVQREKASGSRYATASTCLQHTMLKNTVIKQPLIPRTSDAHANKMASMTSKMLELYSPISVYGDLLASRQLRPIENFPQHTIANKAQGPSPEPIRNVHTHMKRAATPLRLCALT